MTNLLFDRDRIAESVQKGFLLVLHACIDADEPPAGVSPRSFVLR